MLQQTCVYMDINNSFARNGWRSYVYDWMLREMMRDERNDYKYYAKVLTNGNGRE